MATLKVINSKGKIKNIMDYVNQKDKLELYSGINCMDDNALLEMNAVKELYNKTDGRTYLHLIQSFSPDDKLTYEKAHEIAREFIENNNKFNGFQVYIATHNDTDHIHNHIIVNTVNLETGAKFHMKKNELQYMKDINDKICLENNLSIVTERTQNITTKTIGEYKVFEKALEGKEESYKMELFKSIERAKTQAIDKGDFIKKMDQEGYKIEWTNKRKRINFINPNNKKVSSDNLSKTFKIDYSKESFEEKFRENMEKEKTLNRQSLPKQNTQNMNNDNSINMDIEEKSKQIKKENRMLKRTR